MDRTPEYIEMCRKADEIQSIKHTGAGNYYYSPDGIGLSYYHPDWLNRSVEHFYIDFGGIRRKGKQYKEFVWLPRQDQLVKMWTFNNSWDALSSFYWWAKQRYDQTNSPATMEQLALSWVMSQKYGQSWDPENKQWVKE